eukprot:gnl/MRDRNA2_/MRDRNA2_185214_c0_seq1.p1 gnl/MRDRNA2_/MRDRNA2_185214_c0~~gnl/MRDRNA2_/MRDRNA2_185214_c0_seq1.p1  ORF type:complete len:115 (+),score=21.43 gnl/MRDRNA2_/MRDRNA2_185214_c0_seq1:214-558(+)
MNCIHTLVLMILDGTFSGDGVNAFKVEVKPHGEIVMQTNVSSSSPKLCIVCPLVNSKETTKIYWGGGIGCGTRDPENTLIQTQCKKAPALCGKGSNATNTEWKAKKCCPRSGVS